MNERHLAIFEALDGKTSQSDVANRAGVTRQAISLLVQKWKRLGLVMERDGMSVHIVRPSDLGIDVAPLTTRKVKEANGSNPTVS
jgi:predicted transcriptional regulator